MPFQVPEGVGRESSEAGIDGSQYIMVIDEDVEEGEKGQRSNSNNQKVADEYDGMKGLHVMVLIDVAEKIFSETSKHRWVSCVNSQIPVDDYNGNIVLEK